MVFSKLKRTYIGILFHGPSICAVVVDPFYVVDVRIDPVDVLVRQIQGDISGIEHFSSNQFDSVTSVHIGSIDAGAPLREK